MCLWAITVDYIFIFIYWYYKKNIQMTFFFACFTLFYSRMIWRFRRVLQSAGWLRTRDRCAAIDREIEEEAPPSFGDVTAPPSHPSIAVWSISRLLSPPPRPIARGWEETSRVPPPIQINGFVDVTSVAYSAFRIPHTTFGVCASFWGILRDSWGCLGIFNDFLTRQDLIDALRRCSERCSRGIIGDNRILWDSMGDAP